MTGPTPTYPDSAGRLLDVVADRYEVVRALGEGASGRVELVRDLRDGRHRALKWAPLDEPDRCQVLRTEFSVREVLAHPQIPDVLDLGEDSRSGCAYVLMEYVAGATLDAHPAVRESQGFRRLLIQALNVLGFLHRRGVVHGDVKPRNIVVADGRSGAGLVKLVDFGFARYPKEPPVAGAAGTPAYMAPSLLRGGEASHETDLFALGRSFLGLCGEGEDAGTREVLTRLAQEDSHLRYSSADDALADLVAPLELASLPLPRPSTAPFVGRDGPRADLRIAVTALLGGHLSDSLVLVEGAPGLGKSRLLHEVRRDAVLLGADVVNLRVTPAARPMDLLASLLARIPHLGISESGLGALADDEAAVLGGGSLSDSRVRELVRSLHRTSARRPLLLLVDELQVADIPTLRFLRMISRIPAARGPLVVAATNPGNPYVRDHLASDPAVITLRLEPLAETEAEAIVRGLLPWSGDGERVAELARLSEGNPRLATLLARDAGSIREGAGTGVELELMRTRFYAQPRADQGVLLDLAVLLRDVPASFLTTMGTGEKSGVLDSLERLAGAGLVVFESPFGERRYRLVSDSLRRCVVGAAAASDIIAAHRRALAAWETWPRSEDRSMAMLVQHAIGGNDRARALALGVPAVSRLLEQSALATAETLARGLLELSPGKGQREALQDALTDVLIRTGRNEDATSLLLADLAALVPEDLAGRARRLRRLGTIEETRGDLRAALRFLEEARALGPFDDDADALRLDERLGAVHFRLGDYGEARTVWERAAASSSDCPDWQIVADVWNDLGALELTEGRPELAERHHRRALTIRRGHGDLDGEARSLSNLASVAVRRGDLGAASDLHGQSLRLTRHVGTRREQAMSHLNLAVVERCRGEYGSALASLEESLRLRELLSDQNGEAVCRRQLALLHLDKGELQTARRELERARALLDRSGVEGLGLLPHAVAEAEFALACGDLARVESIATPWLRRLQGSEGAAGHAELCIVRGRVRWAGGDAAAAASDLRTAWERSTARENRWCAGWALLYLAQVTRPASSDAARTIEEAIAVGRALGCPRLVAEGLLSLARRRQGQGEDDAAAAHLAEAETIAARVALPDLTLMVLSLKALQARRRGQLARSRGWAAHCVASLMTALDRCEELSEVDYLAHPDRRQVVDDLHSLFRSPALGDPSLTMSGSTTGESVSKKLDRIFRVLQRDASTSSAGDGAVVPEPGAAALLSISQSMNRIHDRDELLGYIRDRLRELFDAERSLVVLLGRDGSLRILGRPAQAAESELSRGIIDRVVARRAPVLVRDTREDAGLRDRSSVQNLGLVSVLCAPLIVEGEVIGVIQFDHRHRPGPFSEHDLVLLELFCNHAATALGNVLLVEQREEANEQLREAQARLVASERLGALGEMAAGVAHDFNNLLATIVGLSDLVLRSPRLDPALEGDVSRLRACAMDGAATVGRMQEFAGGATTARDPEAIELDVVARDVTALVEDRLRVEGRSGHLFSVEGAPVPCVLGRPSEVRDVVMNLVLNAAESMPGGGRITVRTLQRGGRVVLEVEDEGPGISPEVRHRVFEPFFTTKETGHGLGLSICWGIVRRMGGTLDVRAAKGGGTVMAVGLPPGPRTPSASDAASATASEVETEKTAIRILLVDDDPSVRDVLRRILESGGHMVQEEGRAASALNALAAGEFDLVVADLDMPEMDGLELAREVARRRPTLPFILITGWQSPHVEGSRDEITRVLPKPVSYQDLIDAVDEVTA